MSLAEKLIFFIKLLFLIEMSNCSSFVSYTESK